MLGHVAAHHSKDKNVANVIGINGFLDEPTLRSRQ